MYINGVKWKFAGFKFDGILYYNGNEYTDITGGYETFKYGSGVDVTFTKEATYMKYVANNSASQQGIRSIKRFNISNFSVVKVSLTATSNQAIEILDNTDTVIAGTDSGTLSYKGTVSIPVYDIDRTDVKIRFRGIGTTTVYKIWCE